MALPSTSDFALKRLHSLTGVVPLGGFLFMHLWTNAHVLTSPEHYNAAAAEINHMPFLLGVEALGVWAPLLFHSFYGVYIAFSGSNNVLQYSYPRNWMYMLQRVSGFVALAFLLYHVITQRFIYKPEDLDFYRVMSETLSNPLILGFYVLGLASVVFHFANGLWTASIVWGLAVGARTQQAMNYVSVGVGLALFTLGFAALLRFSPLTNALFS